MKFVDFESLFSKMADRAMAKRRAVSGTGEEVRVDWSFYRARYGREWRTCREIALLMGCSLHTVYTHKYKHKALYETRKGPTLMLVRAK